MLKKQLITQQSDFSDNWQGFCNLLIKKFSKPTFDSWFSDLCLVSDNEHTICFSVRSRFIKEWILTNYIDGLREAVKFYKENLLDIEIIVRKKQENALEKVSCNNNEQIFNSNNSNDNEDSFSAKLDARYNFANFIVADENRMPYTAVRSFLSEEHVMQHLNSAYIYAKVGLGKTHLITALAHELQQQQKNFMFLTAERFTYHYSSHIRNSELLAFKEKFENIDFLLLDDIHFFQGKKATQQEVLNIVEYLINQNKKILFVSSKKLNDLKDFDQKLISIMSAGMVTTIAEPTASLKEKIIHKKCELNKYDLSPEIIKFLAAQNFATIREMEGAINKIMIYKNLFAKEINLDNISLIIEDFIVKKNIKKINPENIIKYAAKYFRVSITELKSKNRKKELVLARNITIFLLKDNTTLSLREIGNLFSKRDHATVLYSYNKIKEMQNFDLTLKYEIEKIDNYIKNS